MKCITCPKYSKNKCCDKSYNAVINLPETFLLFLRLTSFHYFIKQQGWDTAAFHVRGRHKAQATSMSKGLHPILSLGGWGHCTATHLSKSQNTCQLLESGQRDPGKVTCSGFTG